MTPSPPPPPRRVALVLRLLSWWALGAVVSYTLAVAAPLVWPPEIYVETQGSGYVFARGNLLTTRYHERVTDHPPSPRRPRGAIAPATIIHEFRQMSFRAPPAIDVTPPSNVISFGNDPDFAWSFIAYESGFPLRCTWGWEWTPHDQPWPPAPRVVLDTHGLWRPDLPWVSLSLNTTCVIPYWPALAADGAIFGGLGFILSLLPGAMRRALRRRRNLCPTCAYPRAGLPPAAPCPECGR